MTAITGVVFASSLGYLLYSDYVWHIMHVQALLSIRGLNVLARIHHQCSTGPLSMQKSKILLIDLCGEYSEYRLQSMQRVAAHARSAFGR
jgi:hypothetical protein